MTFRRWLALVGLVFATVFPGCSGSQTGEGPTAGADDTQTTTVSNDVAAGPQSRDPAEAVRVFLQSLRSGDQEVATQLLTEKARTETAKLSLVVEPPGTPAATYAVGEVEFQQDPNEAHVLSNWTEPTDDGPETYQVVWITKKDAQMWRISGMATRQEGAPEALLINFEDAEMLGELLGPEQGAPTAQSPQVDQAFHPPVGGVSDPTAAPANTAAQPSSGNGLR